MLIKQFVEISKEAKDIKRSVYKCDIPPRNPEKGEKKGQIVETKENALTLEFYTTMMS